MYDFSLSLVTLRLGSTVGSTGPVPAIVRGNQTRTRTVYINAMNNNTRDGALFASLREQGSCKRATARRSFSPLRHAFTRVALSRDFPRRRDTREPLIAEGSIGAFDARAKRELSVRRVIPSASGDCRLAIAERN